MTNEESISLNKYISATGLCSRREANTLIEEGRVTINDKPTQKGNRVAPGDVVKVDGKTIRRTVRDIYIALYKPVGIVCTTDLAEKNNIVSYVNHKERLFPIGRLDKPSEGLILLTNNGDIVNKILRAGNNHEKNYIVDVNRSVTDDFITKMSKGVPILGTVTKKCYVSKTGEKQFKIVLTQGLNRQIRRMCEHFGYKVTKLVRTRIMNIQIGHIKYGAWRELSSTEIKKLKELVADSSKTQ